MNLNINYITLYDAQNMAHWSGLGYFIAKALEDNECRLNYTGNLYPQLSVSHKIKSLAYRFTGKVYDTNRHPQLTKNISSKAHAGINPGDQIVFSPGTIPLAMLETTLPKVFYTDATFAGMIGYYPQFSRYCKESINYAHKLEQAALDSCSLAIYSSEWAAKSALEFYKASPDKVKVVPFGANIDTWPTPGKLAKIIAQRDRKVCHLLWIGVDWERKGGDVAVEIARKLNAKGLPTMLHLVGMKKIPLKHTYPYIINHGFVNKATISGKAFLSKLFGQCHFHVHPARAEAYGLVLCEANAHAIPCIANDTGGITTIVRNDVNGMLFKIGSPIEDYCIFIQQLFSNFAAYEILAHSSYMEFTERLNWKVAGRELKKLLNSVV